MRHPRPSRPDPGQRHAPYGPYAMLAAFLGLGAALGAVFLRVRRSRTGVTNLPAIAASRALVPWREAPLPAIAGHRDWQSISRPPATLRLPRLARWAALGLLSLAAAAGTFYAYRSTQAAKESEQAIGGVADRAIPIMRANGCTGCHRISGVSGAQGQVGPRLDSALSSRVYLAGVLPNDVENMVRWLRFSREMVPHTAMPSTGITEQEARDIAAYLYTLK